MPRFNPMRKRVPVLKRLVPSLLKLIARISWTDGFTVVRSGNARFLVDYRNFVDRQIAFYDDYEAAQLAYFIGCIRCYGCDAFIDVGSNIGYYCVHLAQSTSLQTIVAFEPDVRNYDQLRANLFLNKLSGRVTIHGTAASDRAGLISFAAMPETSTGESRVVMEDIGQRVDAVRVDAVRVDDVVTLTGAAIAIKIDIEGHEIAALRGMQTLLTSNHCLLQVEVFPENLAGFRAVMHELGYRDLHVIGHDQYVTNFPPPPSSLAP